MKELSEQTKSKLMASGIIHTTRSGSGLHVTTEEQLREDTENVAWIVLWVCSIIVFVGIGGLAICLS